MKRNLLTQIIGLIMLIACTAVANAGSRHTFTFNISRPVDAGEPTRCEVKPTLVKSLIGLSANNLGSALLRAAWTSSTGKETFYETTTSDVADERGHWFSKSGIATNKSKSYCIKVVWNAPSFLVSHNAEANAEEGNTYTVKEALINGTDTIVYVFNVSIGAAGSTASVTDDQPAVIGRKSQTDGWLVRPVVRQNEQDPRHENFISVSAGDQITLGCEIIDTKTYTSGKYSWSKVSWDASQKKDVVKTLRTYRSDDFVLTQNAEYDDGGMYRLVARLSDADGKVTVATYYFYVDVQTQAGATFWDWTGEVPQISYDFHTEYPTLTPPTKIHSVKKKNGQPANYYAGKWWSVFWGDDLNDEVGGQEKAMEAAKNMVEKYDTDFEYIYDQIGWPPNLSARNGFKSMIYIFGSGLANDNTSKTEKGGYQSATTVDGRSYACVWASYYPFSRFRSDADQLWSDGHYQREAMIHEGIHTLFADLGACQGSSWFHEGGNVWLQQELHVRRDNSYETTPGYLGAGNVLCPFIPIECYSGWLQDGSFGGPAAQGVNMYNGGQQICTWRNLIGGVQYSDVFPVVFSSVCGSQSVAWIWRYCKNRVLETIGSHIGDEAMRNFITQYRARLALFDLNGWDKGYRNLANNHFGVTVKAEWSPYWIDVAPFRLTPYQTLELNDSAGWMAPDTLTNPGWSGANIIPIHVSGSVANVEFRPEDSHMRALLCYRTKDGKCYYSRPYYCGNMSIDLTPGPANGVIFCVVINTDYDYLGEEQRKHHWDYRLRLGQGALATADPTIKWYFYENTLRDVDFETGIQSVERDYNEVNNTDGVKILSGSISAGQNLQLDLGGINPSDVTVRLVGISGVVVGSGRLRADGSFTLPGNLSPGLYILTLTYGENRDIIKIMVK